MKKFLLGSEEEQKKEGSSRERSFLDLMGVPEFCGWTPGIPEVISQFEEKMKRRCWQILRSVSDVQAPQECLPYGRTVNSEVHDWDPDTARDTGRKTL